MAEKLSVTLKILWLQNQYLTVGNL
jgi:hypothetical protein